MKRRLEDRLKGLHVLPATFTVPEAESAPPDGMVGVEANPSAYQQDEAREFVLRTTHVPFGANFGGHTLIEPSGEDSRIAGILGKCPDYARVHPGERVYLDTETTSLAGGAGVWVFMIGLGSFDERGFLIRQYLMEHPGGEPSMLFAVRDHLLEKKAVVSFCGKSFDAPRTRDRFLYQRDVELASHLASLVHLDLYHAGKRLLGHRMPNHRLQSFERQFLNHERVDDLPGAECAEAYFSYQRGEGAAMERVFEHNRLDVLALPMLEQVLRRHAEHPTDGREALAMGLLDKEYGSGVASDRLLSGLLQWPISMAAAPPASLRRALRYLCLEGELEAAQKLISLALRVHPERAVEFARAMNVRRSRRESEGLSRAMGEDR